MAYGFNDDRSKADVTNVIANPQVTGGTLGLYDIEINGRIYTPKLRTLYGLILEDSEITVQCDSSRNQVTPYNVDIGDYAFIKVEIDRYDMYGDVEYEVISVFPIASFPYNFAICGIEEFHYYDDTKITVLITLRNVGREAAKPTDSFHMVKVKKVAMYDNR